MTVASPEGYRRPGWSPSAQAYPPLGSQRKIHSPESTEGAGRRPLRPAQPDMEQIDFGYQGHSDCVWKGLAVATYPIFRCTAGCEEYVACRAE